MRDTPARRTGRTSKPASMPIQFGEDAVAWAAWLYYSEGLTQERVARSLGVSRASVANYLAQARERGLVRVSMAPDLLSLGELSKRLAERYQLLGVHVMPTGPVDADNDREGASTGNLRQRLGIAGARALEPRLGPQTVLGVAWGRTVLSLAQALAEQRSPHMRIVQISGSSLGDEEHSPECCTALIASRLGAKCENFHAPGIVSSRSMRDRLLAEPGIARHFERIGDCDTVLFGVGEFHDGVVFDDPHLMPEQMVKAYLRKGGIAAMMGRFIDARGNEIDGPLKGRLICIELERLRTIPTRLCVAGGPAKLDAIRAVLAGGHATHLVTDSNTALALTKLTSDPE